MADNEQSVENESPGPHLRTPYVFVDTQAFRRARLDWSGRSLLKLAEFAKQGQLRLLVTDITIGEVKSQIRELLAEASSSFSKHSSILEQLGAVVAVERMRDQASAIATLEAAFDKFMRESRAINVPLIPDVKGVLEDYFARRPPFSTKKKAEFPDAISVASIRSWCQQRNATAYVVSDDPDLRGCCSESGPLYHLESITEVITQATVSKELHDALEEALRASEYLSDRIADELMVAEVEYSRYSRGDRANIVGARLTHVHSVNVISLNVLDQEGQTFTCEPEIEVEIELDLDVEIQGSFYDPEEYEPNYVHSISRIHTEFVYPEVVVRFDESRGALEFESISLIGQKVQVSIDDIGWRSLR